MTQARRERTQCQLQPKLPVSCANRGQALEDLVELSCGIYARRSEAMVYRIGQQAVRKRGGGLAAVDSLPDFMGFCPAWGIVFDAKQTSRPSMPLDKVTQYQRQVLRAAHACGAAAFLLVEFTKAPGRPIYAMAWDWCERYLDHTGRASWALADVAAVAANDPHTHDRDHGRVQRVLIGAAGIPVAFMEAARALQAARIARTMED